MSVSIVSPSQFITPAGQCLVVFWFLLRRLPNGITVTVRISHIDSWYISFYPHYITDWSYTPTIRYNIYIYIQTSPIDSPFISHIQVPYVRNRRSTILWHIHFLHLTLYAYLFIYPYMADNMAYIYKYHNFYIIHTYVYIYICIYIYTYHNIYIYIYIYSTYIYIYIYLISHYMHGSISWPCPSRSCCSCCRPQIHRLLAAELDRSEEAEWRMDLGKL